MNEDLAILPIAWLKLAAAVVAALVFGAFVLGYSVAPAPKPMPAKAAARLVEHRIQTVLDTTRVRQLERENARLVQQGAAIRDTAEQVAEAGLAAHRRADALQAAAIAALTAADSAKAWRAAHDARKVEADSAWRVVRLKVAELATKDAQLVKKDSIISTTTARAERADARLAELEPLATGDDRCRIARYFKCPTRTQATVGGLITGLAAALIVSR